MQKNQRNLLLTGALLAFAALVFLYSRSRTNLPQVEPNGKGYYYTGAVLNKNGTAYADANGNVVPTPPGAIPPPNASKKMPPPGGESQQ